MSIIIWDKLTVTHIYVYICGCVWGYIAVLTCLPLKGDIWCYIWGHMVFWVYGFEMQGFGLRVADFGFRIQGSGLRV